VHAAPEGAAHAVPVTPYSMGGSMGVWAHATCAGFSTVAFTDDLDAVGPLGIMSQPPVTGTM
jgi:hypothetical protein